MYIKGAAVELAAALGENGVCEEAALTCLFWGYLSF